MDNKKFYEIINKYIHTLKNEQLIDFVNNIIRKIPQSKFEEVLKMINGEEKAITDEEIKEKLKSIKEKFNKIEEQILYFEAEECEDFSYGYSDWVTEYTDKDNLCRGEYHSPA